MTGARGLFVVGTDTGVGKTQVACALLRALVDRGERPAPFKPFESGSGRGSDAARLVAAARARDPRARVCPYRFRAPLAPAIAAARERARVDLDRVRAAFAELCRGGRSVIAEGAGGVLVPLVGSYTVADLLAELGLRALVVARDALGTINHTALTIEALRSRAVGVAGVVLNRSSAAGDPSRADNAAAIAGLTGEKVIAVLPFVRSPRPRLAGHAQIIGERLAELGLAPP